MIYAVNLFDILSGEESHYRDYSIQAGRIIYGLGGRVLVAGHRPEILSGDVNRKFVIVVEFPSREVFQEFYAAGLKQGIHSLRESTTANYVWQLFEPWDLKAWVRSPVPELHPTSRPKGQ